MVRSSISKHLGSRLDFDPSLCDLCGSNKFRTVLDTPLISMTSDSRIVASGLRKIQCIKCRLIRNGYPFSNKQLRSHYVDAYKLGRQAASAEPLVFTRGGPLPRSKIIFDWILEDLLKVGFSNPKSIVEIGCGEGSLLSRFANYWRNCVAEGIDMNDLSLKKASERGLKVRQGTYRDLRVKYDLIFSVAVIEHVPSPADFLGHLKSCLSPGGLLVTVQPCQDRGGYDVFFSDHLHHFFSSHIAELGRSAGLREIRRSLSNAYLPDFSLHIFRKESRKVDRSFTPPNGDLSTTIIRWKDVFRNVNRWLRRNKNRRLAVWGVGQTFTFLCAYTNLRNSVMEVAFDDNPDRYANSGFSFPIVQFESTKFRDCAELTILFTFIPRKNLLEMLEKKGITYYCPLASD